MEPTPTPGKTHEQWLEEVVALAATGQAMLKEPLSGDPNVLRDQATQAEDYQVQVSQARSEAEAWLDFHEASEYGKIDRDLTVPERAANLRVRVCQHRLLRDKLEALAMSLRSRMRRAQWNY